MRTHRVRPALAALAALALLSACRGTPYGSNPDALSPPSTRGYGPAVQDGLVRVRAATKRFFDLDSAVAAGYPRVVTACIADPQQGGMGFHHVNRALLDDHLEVERPEILVYERLRDGRYVLNGVEYIVPYSIRSRESTPPTVMGQSLKRADGLELWYLHMWTWRENPAGLFADWNPDVKCEA